MLARGNPDAFDAAIWQAVAPYATQGLLELSVVATITWGRPVAAC